MLDAIGGRKFVFVILCLAVASVIEFYKMGGISTAFSGLIVGLATAFGAANAWNTQQFLSNQQPEAGPDHTADIAEMKSQIETVSGQIDQTANAVFQVNETAKQASALAKAALKGD